jgi:hypothetical protein
MDNVAEKLRADPLAIRPRQAWQPYTYTAKPMRETLRQQMYPPIEPMYSKKRDWSAPWLIGGVIVIGLYFGAQELRAIALPRTVATREPSHQSSLLSRPSGRVSTIARTKER